MTCTVSIVHPCPFPFEGNWVALQLSVVSIKCLKLWAKSEAHPKTSYIGNTPRNPVFIEDFSDVCLVAV